MSDTHLANDPASRTETGEIKDQTVVITEPVKKEAPKTEETKPDTKVEKSGDDVSLLNEKDGDDKDAAKPKEEAKAGAPEKYEPFTLPDGFEANEEMMAEAQATFKELGLTQEQGQKLVDFHAKQAQAAANAPVEYWKEMQKTWQAEIKADPELGGKIPQVRATISKAIDSLGDLAKPFREAMDLTGAGNNPAFVRAFYKWSQQLTEGAHVSGGGPSAAGQQGPDARPKSAAQALYPNLPSSG